MRTVGDILSIDPSSRTGFCRGLPDGKLKYGTLILNPGGYESRAEMLNNFVKWLAPILMNEPPDYLVMEAPLPPNKMFGQTSADVFRLLHGIAGHVESLAWRFKVRQEEATVSQIRCWALGYNMKKDRAKKAVIALAQSWGFDPQDDNAADAIMLHQYFTALHWPDLGRQSQTRMFDDDLSPPSPQSRVNKSRLEKNQNQGA